MKSLRFVARFGTRIFFVSVRRLEWVDSWQFRPQFAAIPRGVDESFPRQKDP